MSRGKRCTLREVLFTLVDRKDNPEQAQILMRNVLKIGGGLLGVAALLVMLIAVAAYVNIAAEHEWRTQHAPSFWGGVAYLAITLAMMGLFSGLAYGFLRYAFRRDS